MSASSRSILFGGHARGKRQRPLTAVRRAIGYPSPPQPSGGRRTGTAASPLASSGSVVDELSVADVRRVIFASSLGTVFEWYDFYLYGSLAAIISKQFFSGVNPTAAFIFALLAFAAGF